MPLNIRETLDPRKVVNIFEGQVAYMTKQVGEMSHEDQIRAQIHLKNMLSLFAHYLTQLGPPFPGLSSQDYQEIMTEYGRRHQESQYIDPTLNPQDPDPKVMKRTGNLMDRLLDETRSVAYGLPKLPVYRRQK